MRIRLRAALTAVVSVAAVVAFAGTASARTLSTTEPNFDMKWTSLRLRVGAEAGVTCAVTLRGAFEASTIAKVNQARRGQITTISTENGMGGVCGSYSMAGTPWEMLYAGFTERLPTITGIFVNFNGANIRFPNEAFRCEFTTAVTTNRVSILLNREGGAAVTELTPNRNERIFGIGNCSMVQLTWEEATRGIYRKQNAPTETVRFTLI